MNNMRLPKLIVSEPATVQALLEIKMRQREHCAILAGGTDVIPLLKRRNISVGHLINVKRIPEFSHLEWDEETGLRIGPAVTLRTLMDHPLVSGPYPLLAQAARSVAFNQLRNMATLGGNICLDNKCTYYNQSDFWWKSRPGCFKRGGDVCYVVKGAKGCFALSAADTAGALIALGAELTVRSAGQERRVPVEDFYTGDGRRPLRLQADEVLTDILIPPPLPGWRAGFLKKSPGGSGDFAIGTLSLCLKMNGAAAADARIALNGVSTKPIRARKTESWLAGKELTDQTIKEAVRLMLKEAAPLSLIGASAFVRRRLISVMFTDLIETLAPQSPA
ncbi:MAG: FAD binding domain-containing protein [Desulfobacterales bacterium]|nr:FAD binding domain-containing protein [Desulfobacterales bacterium]